MNNSFPLCRAKTVGSLYKDFPDGTWVHGLYSFSSLATAEGMTVQHYIQTPLPDELGVTTYFKIDPNSLSRYIGLNDKNGDYIFEGHIIRINDEATYYYVHWDDEHCRFIFIPTDPSYDIVCPCKSEQNTYAIISDIFNVKSKALHRIILAKSLEYERNKNSETH